MATIVTRAGKGSALTWQEGDDNFTNLNDDKIEAVSEDLTPALGGDLDVGTHGIITTETDGDINITADGTGLISLNNDVIIGTGSADAYLASQGARDLFITTDDGADEPYIQLVNGANGGITIQPDGTGAAAVKNIRYSEKVHSLGTTSGTITPDVANGNVQTIELNGNLTFNAFSNPVAGQSLTLIIDTNGTNRTLTSSMKFAGAAKTLSITDTFDIISVFYDGTNYFASLAKGFA